MLEGFKVAEDWNGRRVVKAGYAAIRDVCVRFFFGIYKHVTISLL